MLKQQRGDTALVHVVGNGQGNLRRLKAGDELVAGHSDQVIVQQAEERPVVRAGLAAHPACFMLRGHPAHAEETEVQVLRRHRLVQPFDNLIVPGIRWPDGHDGAIGQQRIRPPGLRECGQPITSAFSGHLRMPAGLAALAGAGTARFRCLVGAAPRMARSVARCARAGR